MPDRKLISGVADTARWVAMYRALESERPDALFHDPYARRLAGRQGEAILDDMPSGRRMAWPMVVRTAVMDEIILRCIADGADTVLNLAAGLDVRAWRMALPHALHWIDVDQAEITAYKTTEMQGETPKCRYEALAMDLADVEARRALFARVDAGARQTLVISEGLLLYLTPDAVATLAADIRGMKSVRRWLTDLASPGLLKNLEKTWGPKAAAGNAPFIFGPAGGTAWFAQHGWREREWRPMMLEGIRLNRTFPFSRFLVWLSQFAPAAKRNELKYFSGMALLEKST